MAAKELCNSRTSLPRQYVPGKHFALNLCFPRPRANLLLPRKPLQRCEKERDDDEQIHAYRKAVGSSELISSDYCGS